MPIRSACISTLLLLSLGIVAEPQSHQATNLKNATDAEKLSYLLGSEMYEKRSKQGFTLDPQMVALAISDEQNGVQPELSTAEYMRIVSLKREIITKFETRWQALSQKNLAEGKAFLAAKAQEPGIVTTNSGLLYKILRPGTGQRPTEKDIARVHYRGVLLSGEEFDSSFKRGKPVDFPVGKVRPAMKEILLLMREGAKWVFYAPPHLGLWRRRCGTYWPQ